MSKKGKVRRDCLKAPAPGSWPPPDFIDTHQVKDTENWWSLQAEYRLPDAWDLIRYNFQTENPLEVNWCLEN